MFENINAFSQKIRKLLILSRTYPWGSGVALNDKRVYEALLRLASKCGKTESIDASQRELSILSGLSRKSVGGTLKRLTKAGLIQLIKSKSGIQANSYSIRPLTQRIFDAAEVKAYTQRDIVTDLRDAMSIRIGDVKPAGNIRLFAAKPKKRLDLEHMSKLYPVSVFHVKIDKRRTLNVVLHISKKGIIKIRRNLHAVESSGARHLDVSEWVSFPPISGHHDAFQPKCLGSHGLSIYEIVSTATKGLTIEQICNYLKTPRQKIETSLVQMTEYGILRKRGSLYIHHEQDKLMEIAKDRGTFGSLQRRYSEIVEERARFEYTREAPPKANPTGQCDLTHPAHERKKMLEALI